MTNTDIFELEVEARASIDAAPAATESTVDFLKRVVETTQYAKKLEYILFELPVVYEEELGGMTAYFTPDQQVRYSSHAATGALGNALRRLRKDAEVEEP